ncbi:restriction endonuclease subunit S [Streptococcus suis]|uniref:restriction endonuclease subunit S n=1 Tax=Streptococcus suis TaxID=1307 RepID=UPI0024126F18|nr:restriction endonuclease subunit S [Streptococcus suis]MDG4520162.1 restriction endonuclease subunit S [Streptococcus suis]
MPNKDRNIPKRRFKEFENADAWELRKLGEVMEVTSVKRIHQSDWTDFGVRFLRARDIVAESKNESVSEPLFISQKKYDEYTAISGKVTKGDLLVTGVGTIGIPMLIEKNEPIYFKDGNIIWFKNENHIDGQFFYYSFIGKKIQSFIKESAGIGTVGTFTINTGKNTPIDLPVLKKEQEAIGTFFSTLDRHITLHQRKLDKLKCVKQAYLSEMFPAEGERVPKRRFPGFTDAWELRKLGEVVYRSNLTSSSKDLPRLEFEDINSGLGTLNKDISQKVDDRKGLEFNEGDVLFGKLRPYLKNWWYAEFKGIALGDFWNLKSDLWHSCFLYTYIQSNSFQLVANDTSGTKMPRSDWNLVAESIAKFPSFPEQTAIGTFFSTLDRHITLHQRKLEKLKNLKKALLNELFV